MDACGRRYFHCGWNSANARTIPDQQKEFQYSRKAARNLVLLPARHGCPLPGFLQDDPHCIEQVDGNAQPACGCESGDWNVQDSPQLKKGKGSRNNLPGTVKMRHGEASSSGEPAHAFSRKEPKVLRWGHETPFFSGGSRENGAEITRRNNDDTPRIDVAAA